MTREEQPLVDTRKAADTLTAEGYPTSPATLTKYRCIGGGPEYEMWGRRVGYTVPNLLKWARSRRVKPPGVPSDDERHPTDDAA
jgi:hypothetical protein